MLQDAIGGRAAKYVDALPVPVAGLHRLRLHPVVRRVAAVQLAVAAIAAPLSGWAGLPVNWETFLLPGLLLAILAGAIAVYAGHPHRGFVAEALLATFLLVVYTNIVGPAQYVGVALGFPLVDSWLATADAAVGIHVPALVAWTATHPWLTSILVAAYFTLLPQFMFALVVLGLVYRDREHLWEYVFHFHVCLTVTLLGVALLPAACAFTYYGFDSLIDQTRFIAHFEGLRAGTFPEVRFDDIEGLISFPSFHVAGGLMLTWAFRRYPRWLVPVGSLNALLIAATVLTGAHYAVDLVATVALFAGSVWLWRAWGRNGLEGHPS